jgi:hypothetical protein
MTTCKKVWPGLACWLATAACAAGGLDDGALDELEREDTTPRVTVGLDEVPPHVQAIAEELLGAAAGSEMAPGWAAGARLGHRVAVFYRPDVEGPAYYGFAVEPAGHLAVATGEHDTPIPFFSDTGTPPARELLDAARDEGRSLRRLIWLDAVSQLAEDDHGRLLRVAATGIVPAAIDLADVEVRLVEQAGALAAEHATHWQELAGSEWVLHGKFKDTNPNLSLTHVKWVEHADLLKTHIQWSQHLSGSCKSGCGPVAWGQYMAYMVENAKRGGKYAHGGAVPTSVYPHGTAFEAQAKALVVLLGSRLGSFCVGDQRATYPWKMDNVKSLLAERGAKVTVESYWTLKPWITLEPRSKAWIQIAQRQRPAILGLGQFEHYAIGLGSGHLNTTRYIWINQGWGGTKDGWLQQSQLFSTAYAVPPGTDSGGGGGGGTDEPPQHPL